ncbi:metal ABC transporter solute-binding protein, Zn/Mn family [Corynebacterium guangdongense]|uniref:Zinc/manganese transport system substrate-binding protein n=1 Tax=Corynebacterium guangdongense TaxID=1783348 RepID=A0ABU2A2D1_9CORY|nr:zinc ABC transporter substrate-binding protein [Corynebacterium guangdongense]MDR7330258.1 zinc/manganese transport system substrate-binding protein [Corynebacterium guangdongense]WJZ18816.1 Periplasmic solute binding protein family protein [Corynebacterium guangdongense]
MTPTPRTATLAAVTAAALLLASCSPATGAAGDAEGTAGAATIVASTAIWADVAQAVAPDADVSAIVGDANVDPHSFEPSAADLARAASADVVVANGGGYDSWLYQVVDQDKIVHALPLVDGHGHDAEDEHADEPPAEDEHADHGHSVEGGLDTVDGNEHIWYDTDAVTLVAEDIAGTVGGDASAVVADMAELKTRIEALPPLRVAQTETIADYIIDDSPMTDVTPAGYRQTQLNEGEPTAADLAAFLDLVEAGEVDLLIYNPQTTTDLTGRIRTAAEDAGVTVIELGETPPAGTDFLTYFRQVVEEISAAAQ